MRYMRKIGGDMIFPYDQTQIANGNCEPLPDGFDPVEFNKQRTAPAKPNIQLPKVLIEDVHVDDIKKALEEADGTVVAKVLEKAIEVEREEKAAEKEANTPLSVESADLLFVSDNLENKTRSELAKICNTMGIPFRQNTTRDAMISKINERRNARGIPESEQTVSAIQSPPPNRKRAIY